MSKDLERVIKALEIMEQAGTIKSELEVFVSGEYSNIITTLEDLAFCLEESISYYNN